MSNPTESYLKKKWKSIGNILFNCGLNVSKIATAGSRARRDNRPDSDYDVIFAISGNPTRDKIYPVVGNKMEISFPLASVYPGENKNIIHIDFAETDFTAMFELVLLTEGQFNKQHKEDIDFRRKYL